MQISERQPDDSVILDLMGDLDLAHSPAMRKPLLGKTKHAGTVGGTAVPTYAGASRLFAGT
jgi:hypothetical protein